MGSVPEPAMTDKDLWKVYANKLRETFLMGEDLGPKNRLYIPPLNSTAIRAGLPGITPQMTQYGLSTIGDSLINADNPLFEISGETYSQRVLAYLQAVELEKCTDDGLVIVRDDCAEKLKAAQASFLAEDKAARKAWKEDEGATEQGTPYGTWAQMYYPSLQSAFQTLQGASHALYAIQSKIQGPGWASLAADIQKVEGAVDIKSPTMYNTEVDSSLVKSGERGKTERKPLYSFGAGNNYAALLKGWINKSSERNPEKKRISFKLSEANRYDWKDVGHTSIKAGGSASFWPFFSVNYQMGSDTKHEEVHAASNDSSIEVTIEAIGMGTFFVNADGSWDPGNVKAHYPNLMEKSSAHLFDPMVQVREMIIGYNVGVSIKLDTSTYDNIVNTVKKAQSHSGSASATFMGFRLNLGGQAEYNDEESTDYNKMKFDSSNHTISFPGANDAVPVLLGVIGTVVG